MLSNKPIVQKFITTQQSSVGVSCTENYPSCVTNAEKYEKVLYNLR
jgi:hypothetical protein